MPETQMEVTNNLYEFLQQWYTLFPMYQASEAQFFLLAIFSFPEQPLLSLRRVLRRQVRSLLDKTHPREEPGGQRQDPVSMGIDYYVNLSLCEFPGSTLLVWESEMVGCLLTTMLAMPTSSTR